MRMRLADKDRIVPPLVLDAPFQGLVRNGSVMAGNPRRYPLALLPQSAGGRRGRLSR